MNLSSLRPFGLVILALFLLSLSRAQGVVRYKVGDIVENFTLTDRATGQPVSLHDLEGSVIFLEWFAHWCPFCQAAAAEVGPGVVEHFAAANGNLQGVPVKHVAINLQKDAEVATQGFINFYKLGLVLNDFDRALANRFQAGGQPIFAIINGVANSPSHRQWELLYSQLGYGMLDFPIATFRNEINRVSASTGNPNPNPNPEPEPEPKPEPSVAPSILLGPVAQTVQPGQAAQFTVGATGEGALVYQWRRNGVDIANAVRPFLKIAGASAGDAGSYSVVVRNAAGGVESTAATLTLDAAAEGRLVNLSSLSFSGAGVDQLVPGFVAEGTVRLLVRAVGPSLAGFGVTGPLADPFLHIARSGEFVASNDDWGDNGAGSAIMDAASRVGGFALAGGSADSALLFDYEGGPRSAPVSDSGGGSGAALVEVYEVPTEGRNGRLVNLATRGLVVADGTLVAGFVIGGTGARTVLVRGVGPSLGAFGVPGVLADPGLTLARSGTVFVGNDDWESDPVNMAEVTAAGKVAGAFELAGGSADAAMLITLSPGQYTVQVTGPSGASGIVLAEIYDVTGRL